MSCERPLIAPISDQCCFSCYVMGRVGYVAPIAIVLHEVDEHIEALNNRIENCCHDDPDCHSSFHYGVGHDGRIINWVDPANTAWSFDPMNSDQNCGICGWSIATQEGTGVDPNLYTVNIAVSTGILAFDQSSPNSLAQNNYTEQQYNALVRLTGWLAETYNIVVNQNTIWRHCDELDDFPGGCCCNDQNENCDCQTYADFLAAVQACIDSSASLVPWLCDAMCDGELLPGTPTFIFGADASCDVCGRYQLGEVIETNFCTIMNTVVQPEGLPATPGLPIVMQDCTSWLMPDLCQLMNLSTIPDGAPIVDNTLSVLGSDCQFHVIDLAANLDLCPLVPTSFVTDGGEAVPGITNLLGLDCSFYQLPMIQDLCQMIFGATDVYDPLLNFVLLQNDGTANNCRAVVVDNSCDTDDFVDVGLGLAAGQPAIGRIRPSLPRRMIASDAFLAPSTDGVVYVDANAGNVTLTLVPPVNCEVNVFHVKRVDTNAANTVTIAGGANLIDGSANIVLATPGAFSPNSGQSVMVYWDSVGAQWTVH